MSSDAAPKQVKGSAAESAPAAALSAAKTAPESAAVGASKSAAPAAPAAAIAKADKGDKGKTGARPAERKATSTARRGGSPVRSGRRSVLRNVLSYLRAYVPLFIVFALVFAAIWAFTTITHTPTPKENWTRIESIWKPKRDADLKTVSAAIAANDFNAAIAGYKSLSTDTKGWMDELGKIKDWEGASASPSASAGATGTATQFVQVLIADGQAEASVLDRVVAAKSMDDILALKTELATADAAFQGVYVYAPTMFGGTAVASDGPTLALPSGSLIPSGSPAASGASAGPSTSASPSASPS